MSAKGSINDSTDTVRILRPVAVSVAFGAVVSVVILVLFALLLSGRTIPQPMIDPMATFAMSVGAFVSGLICAKMIHRNGLMCGLICGIVFAAILLACSFAVPDSALGLGALIKIALMLFSSMIGGVLGVNTKRRKR